VRLKFGTDPFTRRYTTDLFAGIGRQRVFDLRQMRMSSGRYTSARLGQVSKVTFT
jgi:hypothetical protein